MSGLSATIAPEPPPNAIYVFPAREAVYGVRDQVGIDDVFLRKAGVPS